MIYYFLLFIAICCWGVRFKSSSENESQVLSRSNTVMINGMFVILILFSHFFQYVSLFNYSDLIVQNIIAHKIQQLMVTTFLFFSGYGIYEQIKKNSNYMDSFIKKRFLKVYISFASILMLYVIANYILGNNYSLKDTFLSFLGISSIGNSNWFMYCTLCMYICVFISFKLLKLKRINSLLLCTILSFVYVFITIRIGKDTFWYNTCFCFMFGMWFSYFKDHFFIIIKDKVSYLLILILLIICFYILYRINQNWFAFELLSCVFVLIIILITSKVSFGNIALQFLGKNTFNIYIIQRLVYSILSKLHLNIYLYFSVSVILILVLAFFMDKIFSKIFKILKI